MTYPFKVFIPARYTSSRLPGKALEKIGNKTLLRHIYDDARCSTAREVIIVTDDRRIEKEARRFGARVIMTSENHNSGTERIAEAVVIGDESDDAIVVNIQGDEYGMSSALIDQVADALHRNEKASIATLCEKITGSKDFLDPNIVKVVFDRQHRALYFSRAPIPVQAAGNEASSVGFNCPPYRHIGIYAYRVGFLKTYAELPSCALETSEQLEQLRAQYFGFHIHVEEAVAEGGIGINTGEDLALARRMYADRHGEP